MKRTDDSVSESNRLAIARIALAVIVIAFGVLLFATPPSKGAAGRVLAQPSGSASPTGSPSESPDQSPSPSPTGAPAPTGPVVTLVNPNLTYDPLVGNHPVGSEPIPQISDLLDADETYHVVARSAKVPADATGVAVWASDSGGETTIGDMERTQGMASVWETFWNVPESLDGDTGKVFVRLYDGNKKIAEHSVEAEVDLAEETVEMLWPTNGGRLGFFKSTAGPWRFVVEGITSAGAPRVYVRYSTTPRGQPADFDGECGFVNPAAQTPFQVSCILPAAKFPSDVTAVAMVAAKSDNPTGTFPTQEAADAHGVRTYLQDPATMQVDIAGVPPTTVSEDYPTGERRLAGDGCIEYDMVVTDHLDRPVQGANVDVHVKGPVDEAGFGIEASTSTGSSTRKPPEEGGHTPGDAWDCDSPGDHTGNEGRHEDADGKDTKHIESIAGTGLNPSGVKPGVFRFHVFSPAPGLANITGWVDEEGLKKEDGLRKPNNDRREKGEAVGRGRAQFLDGPVNVRFSPAGDSALVGDCHPWRIRVRGGKSWLDGVNVDVHASGPSTDLDFCDPPGGADMKAPDLPPDTADTKHTPEDEDEASHPSNDPEVPDIQHSEGTTDEQGDLVFGLTSPLSGDTTVTAWVDGEPGQDNDDVQGTGEPAGTATLSWASTAGDAEVRFVNPSGYGGAGDNVSTTQDSNATYHVVTRVDSPSLIQGVEVLISSDGATFTRLGTATRVAQSDIWEFAWDPSRIEDGSYTLRARIFGTEQFDDREINLDNSLQTAEIAQPADTAQAIFVEGKTTVSGTASAAAEGVDFFYTTAGANQDLEEEQWTACGNIDLATGEDPQPFSGECALVSGDFPNEVTGIAALAILCDPIAGCDEPLGSRAGETGDAHRVFGAAGNPVLSLNVGDGGGDANTCQRITVQVSDQAGEPIAGINTDIHLRGPSNEVEFCELDASTNRAPDQGGHSSESGENDEAFHSDTGVRHTEGETGSGGRLIVGIRSATVGTSDLDAWLDLDDDDVRDNDEPTVDGAFEWRRPGACTEVGTPGDDVLVGGRGVDRLCGRGGDDVIVGKGRNDILIGGRGNDVLRGNAGRDILRGGKGQDTLIGGPGRDRLNGGPGRDRCRGGPGRDRQKNCE